MKDAEPEDVAARCRAESMRADKVMLNVMVWISGCLAVCAVTFWLVPFGLKGEALLSTLAVFAFSLLYYLLVGLDWEAPPFDGR